MEKGWESLMTMLIRATSTIFFLKSVTKCIGDIRGANHMIQEIQKLKLFKLYFYWCLDHWQKTACLCIALKCLIIEEVLL